MNGKNLYYFKLVTSFLLPSLLSANTPMPAIGESPTRPTSFPNKPPVLVAAAKFPSKSITTAPTVP